MGRQLTKPPGLTQVRKTSEAGADKGHRDSAGALKASAALRRFEGLEQLQVGGSQLGILQIQRAVCLEDCTRPLHVHACSVLCARMCVCGLSKVVNA